MIIKAVNRDHFIVSPERWESEELADKVFEELIDWLNDNADCFMGLSYNQAHAAIKNN